MKKASIILWVSLCLLIIILGIIIYKFNFINDNIHTEKSNQINIHDGTYIIDGKSIVLKDGISEIEVAPGSASKTITRYFGNDIKYDFNKDGIEDLAFILTQENGGSGIFYYVVALLNTPNGPIGSHGLFLGDRISPQTTEMGKGNIIIVNYADRKQGESFTISPSIAKSIWLLLDTKTMQFGEVSQNFEGEADPKKMTLDMKTWNWVNTIYSDNKEVKPINKNKFTLTFKDNKTFSSTTDCNGVGGEYTVDGNKISFNRMMSTQMYCENSQEADFSKMLNETQSYLFTSKGELVLNLKFDSGSVIFR